MARASRGKRRPRAASPHGVARAGARERPPPGVVAAAAALPHLEPPPSDGALPHPAPRYRQREGHLLQVDDATSARMGLVRQKGTRPELLVRNALSELGHRFRLGNRDLPGSPDIANRSRRWAVFVHGCFWHRHGCKATTTPGRNREFWEAKFARNIARDEHSADALRALGYTVIVIWECDTKRNMAGVREALARALSPAA